MGLFLTVGGPRDHLQGLHAPLVRIGHPQGDDALRIDLEDTAGVVVGSVLRARLEGSQLRGDVVLVDNALGHLILVPTPVHKDGGDFDLVDGLVSNDGNRPLTYSGIAVYRPELFAGQLAGRFSLVPLIREAADAGRLSGSIYEGLWEDIGTAERLAKLNEN